MINTKLTAYYDKFSHQVCLKDADGHNRVSFDNFAFFYIVTGFKTVEAYNEHQDEKPVKFLVWPREH